MLAGQVLEKSSLFCIIMNKFGLVATEVAMKNVWEEREQAFENQYIYQLEKQQAELRSAREREQQVRTLCRDRCPKCGEKIVATVFRDVPLDQCPACQGVWLGPNDLKILAQKDHRSWFDLWFGARAPEPPENPDS